MQKTMTKQEEIREGIDEFIHGKKLSGLIDPWAAMLWDKNFRIELLAFLHSKDVVIKVERELPMPSCSGTEEYVKGYSDGGERILNDLDVGDYGAFEPLIKDKQ